MNIGIFTQCYLPTLNGVVISIEAYRKEFERAGHKVFVFAPRYRGYKDNSEDVFRFPAFHSPSQPDYPVAFPYSRKILSLMPKLNLQVIHTQHPFVLGTLGLRIAKKYGLPLIFTYHTLLVEYVHYMPFLPFLSKKIAIKVSRDYCNKCDCVIAPTRRIKDLLRSYGVKTRIEVIPTGVELAESRPINRAAVRQRHGVPEDCLLLLNVGRLAKEKNSDFLLRAFKIVVDKFPKAHLMLIGGGHWETYCKGLARDLGILQKVTFAGYLPHEEVMEVCASADIFVSPSVTETQGIVFVEAMSKGLPVVGMDAYGAGDIIKETGAGLLSDYSVEDFSSKIIQLLADKDLRERLSRQAQEQAQKFSSAASARRVLQIYQELI